MKTVPNKELVSISSFRMCVGRKILNFWKRNSFGLPCLKLNWCLKIFFLLSNKTTSSFGMDTELGSLSRVGVSAQPCLSPNHNLYNCWSLVARWLAAVHGVSRHKVIINVYFHRSNSKPKMFVGALYFLDSFMSIQSLTDSDKNNIFEATIHPWRQDSLYLHL